MVFVSAGRYLGSQIGQWITYMDRPEFDDIKDYEEFIKYYWYRDELIRICKEHGLKASGTKIELNNVIHILIFILYFFGNIRFSEIMHTDDVAYKRIQKSQSERYDKFDDSACVNVLARGASYKL